MHCKTWLFFFFSFPLWPGCLFYYVYFPVGYFDSEASTGVFLVYIVTCGNWGPATMTSLPTQTACRSEQGGAALAQQVSGCGASKAQLPLPWNGIMILPVLLWGQMKVGVQCFSQCQAFPLPFVFWHKDLPAEYLTNRNLSQVSQVASPVTSPAVGVHIWCDEISSLPLWSLSWWP